MCPGHGLLFPGLCPGPSIPGIFGESRSWPEATFLLSSAVLFPTQCLCFVYSLLPTPGQEPDAGQAQVKQASPNTGHRHCATKIKPAGNSGPPPSPEGELVTQPDKGGVNYALV